MSTLMPKGQELPDIQSLEDNREVAIDRVGVSHVRHPALVTDTDGTAQPVTATFCMTVSLPGNVKGTHMSRFLQILPEHQDSLGPGRLDNLVTELRTALDAEIAQVDMDFPWFISVCSLSRMSHRDMLPLQIHSCMPAVGDSELS